jgi:hypothetical protein
MSEDICHCDCHKCVILHCFPCCCPCPNCGQNITTDAWLKHKSKCVSFVDIVKARFELNKPGYDFLKEHGD